MTYGALIKNATGGVVFDTRRSFVPELLSRTVVAAGATSFGVWMYVYSQIPPIVFIKNLSVTNAGATISYMASVGTNYWRFMVTPAVADNNTSASNFIAYIFGKPVDGVANPTGGFGLRVLSATPGARDLFNSNVKMLNVRAVAESFDFAGNLQTTPAGSDVAVTGVIPTNWAINCSMFPAAIGYQISSQASGIFWAIPYPISSLAVRLCGQVRFQWVISFGQVAQFRGAMQSFAGTSISFINTDDYDS